MRQTDTMELSKEELAILRLSLTDGIGPVTGRGLIERFGSAERLYATSAREMQADHAFSSRLISALLRDSAPMRAVEEQLRHLAAEEAEGKPVRLVFAGSESYPPALEACPDAPLVLYVKGQLPRKPPMIGVVGTRRNTPYALDVLRHFIRVWADERPDLVIVSGLAYGVDAIGHRLALECGLRTIGVVAHGLDTLYPSSHKVLAGKIIDSRGAVVTEFPYGTRALPQRFIARNRIVAGLTLGLVVGESAAHGGALTTASFALDYGRSVYAVPGRLFDPKSEGCNRLIAENKAAIATDPHEILEDLGLAAPTFQDRELPFAEEEDPDEDPILRLLRKEEDLTIGDLSARTGDPISRLSAKLFTLEMEGVIRALPGGRYALVRTR